MTKLKDCPFCGSIAVVSSYNRRCLSLKGETYKVECRYCDISPETALYEDKMEAIKVWNERKSSKDQRINIDDLRD